MGFELGTDGPGAIVVGVDGSDASMRAAAYAAGLARRRHTRLVLVYVRNQPPGLLYLADRSGLAAEQVVDAHDETEAQLRAMVRRQAAVQGVDADLIVRSGEAAHELSDVAAKVKADEVVVGSSASVGHRIAGALGARLIRVHRWPVTVVP